MRQCVVEHYTHAVTIAISVSVAHQDSIPCHGIHSKNKIKWCITVTL